MREIKNYKRVDGFDEVGVWTVGVNDVVGSRGKAQISKSFVATVDNNVYGHLDGATAFVLTVQTETASNSAIQAQIVLRDSLNNIIETLQFEGATINSGATAFFHETISSEAVAFAHSYKLTFSTDIDADLFVNLDVLHLASDHRIIPAQSVTESTDDEWVILDAKETVMVALKSEGAGVSAYVEAAVTLDALNDGSTEIWPIGTITNTTAYAELAPVYAVRFHATAGAGQKLYVQAV